jgi:hypothetical protein
MMHSFSLVFQSMVAYPWSRSLIVRTQTIVSFFRGSHRPNGPLSNARATLKISRRLQSANKTRMTSQQSMVRSVVENEMALKLVVQQGISIKADVKAIIEDRTYWGVRHLLHDVLLHFEAVMML